MTHVVIPKRPFWQDKRVLITGHTGFKGGWLAIWLHRLGARVAGLALPPESVPNLFTLAGIERLVENYDCDIREPEKTAAVVAKIKPEIIFHMAAQSLVRESYSAPLATFAVNIQGTANVLDALRHVDSARVAVAVTTDKVYRNLEHHYPYRETDALGGHDPYSASKAGAEIVIASYRDAFLGPRGMALASARAGNVIGGGDWARDRLIPDLVRAWETGAPARIRHPQAVRPWQHVLDPLAGYLKLAECLWENPALAGPYNFGPATHEVATVRDVVESARAAYGRGEAIYDEDRAGPHEAGLLTLETAKARALLGVNPRWSLAESVARSMRWYRQVREGTAALAACEMDLSAYEIN